jgi:hypothetical protein
VLYEMVIGSSFGMTGLLQTWGLVLWLCGRSSAWHGTTMLWLGKTAVRKFREGLQHTLDGGPLKMTVGTSRRQSG